MTPKEAFSQWLGLGKCWRVVRTEFEEKASTFGICVGDTAELWPEESRRVGITVSSYDRVEPLQWRRLNLFRCVIVCPLRRGRRGDDGDAAFGGT